MKDERGQHRDLEALLADLPPEEAERLRAVWALAGPAPAEDVRPEEVDAAVGRLHEALGFTPTPRGRRLRLVPRPAWAALAASVVIAAVALGLWMRPAVHTAAPGATLAVTLPDGSAVELNSGSTLRHPRRFGDVRAVALEGEAFFEVVPGARPFVVETHDARVRVLGTRFAVRAWPHAFEGGTTVALEEGRVALAPAARPDRAVTLAPGEARRVSDGAAAAADVSVADALAWRRGHFVLKDQHLAVVAADVGRRYGVEVHVQPRDLLGRRLNLVLRQPADAETVVRTVAATLGLRYRETSTGFELYQE